ncbi:MAG: hypothetical protein H7X79_05810 [Sporomusaceae bacterium]|nr:hypothetical protein [Sporomusaceae bacterium]
MEIDEVLIPWYRCKRDAIVVMSNLLATIAFFSILGLERIGTWSQTIATWGFIEYLFPLTVYISWSMWPCAIALIIIAARLCLNHYWKWINVSWIALSIIFTVAMELYGFKEITASLAFKGIGIASEIAIFNFPIYFGTAKVVYILRKKRKGKDGKEGTGISF